MGEVARENLYTIGIEADGTRVMVPYVIYDRAKMKDELAENDRRNQAILDSRRNGASTRQGDEAVAHEEVPE